MSDQVKIPLPRSLQEIVGSLLFASQDPLSASELRDAVRAVEPEEGENAEVMDVYKTCTSREIDEALKGLGKALEVGGCGFKLVCTGGTYRLQTVPSCGRYVRAMLKLDRPSRLGRASLETLAIIAYRQPIAKSEIEEIRGVDVSANIKTLMDLQLIRLVGRSELPGHPFLYGTTQIFLDHFGIANLQQLNELDPTLQRSNPRLKAEQYKRVEKKTDLEKAAEEANKEAAETAAPPVTDEAQTAGETPAPPVTDDEMEDLTGKAGILPADTTAASEEDDFFIDDTPDEFDDEDEDDEDEDEEDEDEEDLDGEEEDEDDDE
ncbi:MAG: SMC-Scp complex subunit ScpB [Kiritimatiellae bacterium]|nr:SMC-Scp complex subunit ScpB [Kiritimatiellia bacterium]